MKSWEWNGNNKGYFRTPLTQSMNERSTATADLQIINRHVTLRRVTNTEK